MKFYTIDGSEYEANLAKHANPDQKRRSKLHIQARELLLNIFPLINIIEEMTIITDKGQPKQYIDFFIPAKRIVIEINGEQHYKFCPHFHGNMQGFIKQKKRDEAKATWCEINGIKQIILAYNEDINEWRKRITTEAGVSG